jgi:arabinofuranosyltransferase
MTEYQVRDANRRVGLSLTWLTLVLVPLYLFRWVYFGALLPNSVLAKSGGFKELLAMPLATAARHVIDGRALDMLRHFASNRLGLLVFALPLGWLSVRYRRQTSVFAIACVLFILPLVWNDGDWMPHMRLLAPTIPLICVGLAASASVVGGMVPVAWKTWVQSLTAIAIFTYCADHFYYERNLTHQRNATAEYMCDLGRALARTSNETELLATDMAGRVPYFSKIRTLDVFGLNDAHIARHGTPLLHMGKTDFAYVYPKRPSYYFYNVRQNIRYMYDSEAFRPFANDYWLVITPFFAAQHGSRGKVLLVRKDLSRLQELLRNLDATVIDPRKYH